MADTRAPIIGVIATDEPRAGRSAASWAKWSRMSSNGPPSNKVAFAISQWDPIGPVLSNSATRLRLPLSLHEPWFREHLTNGHEGYRWGYLRVHGQVYGAKFWSGRAAPARDRAAVLRALASVRSKR